jgi:threonyl-tRNA synthetase
MSAPHVNVVVSGEQKLRDIDDTTTWGDVLVDFIPGLKGVAVARVDGELVDLDQPARAWATVEPVLVSDPDGLRVLRHSTAHVLAQAVQHVFPDAKLGIGPPIENGFYYEFDIAEPFTPEDLAAIEKRMVEILKKGQRFARRVVTEADALAELADEPYKCRLVGSEGGADVMEVGGKELTIYDNLDLRSGERVWGDLCRGPHVPTTRLIAPNAFKVMRSSAAYWLGNQANEQLQRIYGTAWPDK